MSIMGYNVLQLCDFCLPDNKEYVDFVKGLSNDEFEFFKNILLKQELYEEVANMIKIRD